MPDGSSTETEDAGHYSVADAKARRQRATKKIVADASKKITGEDPRWTAFLNNFEGKIASCRDARSGCCFCCHDCLLRAERLLDEIKAWRENMMSVASDVVDRELIWIFRASQTAAA